MKRTYLMTLSVLALSACSINPELYKENPHSLSFSNYFDGKLCAWGTVKDRSEQVTRRFVANINAYKDQSQIVLDEQFIFSDGEKQTRLWRFNDNGQSVVGTAGDVVGKATGTIYGDSLQLTYTLSISQPDSSIEVNMNDWLHLIDSRTLMGTTDMTKWGFDVGQIDIVIRKEPQTTDCFASLDLESQTTPKSTAISNEYLLGAANA